MNADGFSGCAVPRNHRRRHAGRDLPKSVVAPGESREGGIALPRPLKPTGLRACRGGVGEAIEASLAGTAPASDGPADRLPPALVRAYAGTVRVRASTGSRRGTSAQESMLDEPGGTPH